MEKSLFLKTFNKYQLGILPTEKMKPTINAWKVVGSQCFTQIDDVASCTIQSANVEEVCKIHGVIYTKE